jgi:hypothetical protein
VRESYGSLKLCELKAQLSRFQKLSRIFAELQSRNSQSKSQNFLNLSPQSSTKFFKKLLESYSFAKFINTSKGET